MHFVTLYDLGISETLLITGYADDGMMLFTLGCENSLDWLLAGRRSEQRVAAAIDL